MEAPRHVLLVLDDEGDLHSVGEESGGEALGGETPELSDDGRADAMNQEPWRPGAVVDAAAVAFGETYAEQARNGGPKKFRGKIVAAAGMDDHWNVKYDDDGEVYATEARHLTLVSAPSDDGVRPAPERRRTSASVAVADEDGGAGTASSRFWGVTWDRRDKKWMARYRDADGKDRHIGYYDDEEEAARAVNKAIRDAGLQGKRRMNAVDATGALVPKAPGPHNKLDHSAVAPDPARDLTATTSKFWGVSWDKRDRRWKAAYKDANGTTRHIGHFDTQEAAAHAYNAAIRALPPDVQARRKTNPVVHGQLVPKPPRKPSSRKRRREDAPGASASRSRHE